MLKQAGNTFLGLIIGLAISLSGAAVIAIFWGEVATEIADAVRERAHMQPRTRSLSAPIRVEHQADSTTRSISPSHLTINKLNKDSGHLPLGSQTDLDTFRKDSGEGSQLPRFYRLQAGSFKDLKQAETTKAKLAMLGIESSLITRNDEHGEIFRVIAGPFTDSEMKILRVKIQESGMQAIAIRAKD